MYRWSREGLPTTSADEEDEDDNSKGGLPRLALPPLFGLGR